VIDEHSYWIDAYFDETKLANIHVGDPVEATLLGFQPPINGGIESITGGISAANAASSTTGPSKRRPDLHLGSACATNSGAYQDRTSPFRGIARCRNDLQRLSCRRKANAGGHAQPGLFYRLENLL
jgi:hypothetical protein